MKILGVLNNQLIILELENKEQILKCYEKSYPFSKFVIVYKDDEYYVIFLTYNHYHSDMVIKLNAENFSFIGAGNFSRDFRLKTCFDSPTCKTVFGYDRPKEQEKQELLLEDVEKIVEYIFNL